MGAKKKTTVQVGRQTSNYYFGIDAGIHVAESGLIGSDKSDNGLNICDDIGRSLLPNELKRNEIKTYLVTFEEVEPEYITKYGHKTGLEADDDTVRFNNTPPEDAWTVEDDFKALSTIFGGFKTSKGRTWTQKYKWDREL